MIDWDNPIETTEGLPARLLSTDYRVAGNTFMLVQIEHHSGSLARTFHEDGSPYLTYPGKIRNRKTKREGWINVYANTNTHGPIWGTEEEAKTFQTVGSITTIKIEWEE
jgi:hypothetical protein